MHSKEFTINRIFDVQFTYWGRGGPKCTLLGIEVDGIRHFNVVLNGWQEIQPQTRVTAFFRRPGDWKQLVGWVCHATGQVVTTSPPASLTAVLSAALMVAVWVGLLANGSWLLEAQVWLRIVVFAGTLAVSLQVLHSILRFKRTLAELAAVSAFRVPAHAVRSQPAPQPDPLRPAK